MSEAGLVAILVALITAVGSVSVGLVKPRKAEPITQKDAVMATATPAEQLSVAMIEAMQRELEVERAARKRVEVTVEKLQRAREEDAEHISTLRYALEVCITWAEDLRARWATVRLEETPPPMPKTTRD